MRQVRGVITDWGGVMTNPVIDSIKAWIAAESVDPESYFAVMRPWVSQAYEVLDGENPVHAMERGETSHADFEHLLAARLIRLDGGPVAGEGLLARMFAGTVLDAAMLEVVRRLHATGVPTGLLSNSWGANDYPRELFPDMFDAVVISAEVGMRKPEPRIFLHAAGLLSLEPADCVFIDDIEANVRAAEELGFAGVHHSDPITTRRRLADLLGLEI